MKLEMIKNALKARTLALNIKPASVVAKAEEKIAPVESVAIKQPSISNAEVEEKNDEPVESKKPEKISTAPIQPTLISTEDQGDTVKIEPVKKSDSESEKPNKPPVKVEGVISASELPPKEQVAPDIKPEVEEKPVAKKPARPRKKAETEPVAVPVIKKIEPPELDIETVIRTLKAGVDYDTIPNCGRKPTLLKAGAEHLAQIFKFRTMSEIVSRVEVLEKSFVLYEFKTTVYNENGAIVAIGYGSANTQERKFMKQGFAASLNVVLKIARKRSFVDSILTATSASRIFTQDIEELRESEKIIPIDIK